jgi:hypothetical protein
MRIGGTVIVRPCQLLLPRSNTPARGRPEVYPAQEELQAPSRQPILHRRFVLFGFVNKP